MYGRQTDVPVEPQQNTMVATITYHGDKAKFFMSPPPNQPDTEDTPLRAALNEDCKRLGIWSPRSDSIFVDASGLVHVWWWYKSDKVRSMISNPHI